MATARFFVSQPLGVLRQATTGYCLFLYLDGEGYFQCVFATERGWLLAVTMPLQGRAAFPWPFKVWSTRFSLELQPCKERGVTYKLCNLFFKSPLCFLIIPTVCGLYGTWNSHFMFICCAQCCTCCLVKCVFLLLLTASGNHTGHISVAGLGWCAVGRPPYRGR